MKKTEINVGGYYIAKVNNNLTVVRVISIRESGGKAAYDVVNGKTLRRTVFRSAAKFRRKATPDEIEKTKHPDATKTDYSKMAEQRMNEQAKAYRKKLADDIKQYVATTTLASHNTIGCLLKRLLED